MTPAVETVSAPARSRLHGLAARGAAWDVLAVCALAALWAVLLPLRRPVLPLQLWDESRNAVNALEMALHGHWLTPTYAGVVDHWNTKPPLLIWTMAALLRAGVAPLAALRAPSWLAVGACAAMVWGVARGMLKDRAAAFAAAALLLSAGLFTGAHVGRTGDYDALESAFVLAAVLAAWAALEEGHGAWVVVAALALAFGVLTKGVAALLIAPGLALYALGRRRQAVVLLRSPLAWVGVSLFLVLSAGYYLGRERVDPGYLSAVAGNEVGGRFLHVSDNHRGDPGYYLRLLWTTAQPCALLAPLAALLVMDGEPRRRRLALAAALSAASLLGVLACSQSKLPWYAAPSVPLLGLLAALGLTEALRRAGEAVPRLRAPLWLLAGAVLAVGAADAVARPARPKLFAPVTQGSQLRYGEFLDAVRRSGAGKVDVLDGGFVNDAGFRAYDPMLRFYAEGARGLDVGVLASRPAPAPGRRIGSCDPAVLAALERDQALTPMLKADGCVLFIAAPGGRTPQPGADR